jgi:transposase InsO family protein
MLNSQNPPQIPLPKGWKKHVRSGILHVLSLAQYAAVYTRSWAADGVNQRVQLKAEIDRLSQEIALLREEIRIKDARLARINPHRRPHYATTERMAILELRAARHWCLEATARVFLITAATVRSWMKRVDEEGRDALVQLGEPVNRFPDFVRYVVQRLKVLCPTMGKVKIAQTLARAGLHLGATTVGRILKEQPAPIPEPTEKPGAVGRVVTSKYPNHVWNVDLTTVPSGAGFWCSWLPFALPQRWPFCWWVAVVIDHYSRRVMGTTVFNAEPSAVAIRAFLGRTIAARGVKPKHLICDKGSQFWPCKDFKNWCDHKNIKPRFGAVGKHGSLAIVERFILTMKQVLAQLPLIPLRRKPFRHELAMITEWYNEQRPHMGLAGKTPNEVFENCFPAHRKPRIEPRARWPRGSPCAKPQTLVAGKPGQRFDMTVRFHAKRRHLPIVTLKRAA